MTTIKNDDFKVTPVQEHAIKNVAKTIVSGTDAIHEAEEREKQAEESRLENIKEYNKLTDEEKKAKYGVNSPSLDAQAIREELEAEAEAEAEAEKEWKEIKELHEAVTTLQRNADAQKQLISSVNDKNQTLQNKLTFVNDANCTIMFPNHLIESIINKQIEKVNNKLMDSVNEVNEVIEKLYQDDIQEALKQVNRINDLKNRVCELEDVDTSRLEDLDYDIESEVQNQLGNCYYVEEDEVNNIIDDRLEEFVTRDDINHDLRIYGREINELKARLDNTIYNKVCRLVKGIFSYNLTNKVRSIFKRNKKEANTTMPSKK